MATRAALPFVYCSPLAPQGVSGVLSIHVGNNRGTKDNVRAELTIEFAVGNEDGQFWGVVRSGCTHCVWWLMKNDFFLGQFGKKNMSFDFGA